MTRPHAAPAPAPDHWWWSQVSEHAAETHHATLRDARVHYRRWSGDGPLLLFVHGFRGHTHWWDWIAPSFATDHEVVAIDLSGMGDSDWRAAYEEECFADDVLGLIEHLGRPATVIGHSFGGTQLLRACARDSTAGVSRIARGIVVDTWVRVLDEPPYTPSTRARETGPYPDFETARSRFRLNPVQPVADAAMLEHIARHSVRTRDGLWQWKFDPKLEGTFIRDPRSLLRSIETPLDIVHGEHSRVMTRERAEACVGLLRHGRGPVTIPAARHHMMFDQPVALVATLRALRALRR